MTDQIAIFREPGSRFYIQVAPRHLVNTGPSLDGEPYEVIELWSALLYEDAQQGKGPDLLRGEGFGDTRDRAVADALVDYHLVRKREAEGSG